MSKKSKKNDAPISGQEGQPKPEAAKPKPADATPPVETKAERDARKKREKRAAKKATPETTPTSAPKPDLIEVAEKVQALAESEGLHPKDVATMPDVLAKADLTPEQVPPAAARMAKSQHELHEENMQSRVAKHNDRFNPVKGWKEFEEVKTAGPDETKLTPRGKKLKAKEEKTKAKAATKAAIVKKVPATKAPPAKDTKKKDAKPAVKKKPEPKSTGKADYDEHGTRLGTKAAVINTYLTKVPQTAEVLAKATGFKVARVEGHMAGMVRRGKVKTGPKGFRWV